MRCARGYAANTNREETNKKISKTLKGSGSTDRLRDPEVIARAKTTRNTNYALRPFTDLTTNEARRKRILEEQNGKCNHCGNHEWRGKPLILELEHRDGNNQNNERGNLECICPNCHSQTPTWRGRNKALRKGVSDEQMVEVLRSTRSMHKTLLHFGMAAKGGNYKRTKRLVEEYGIEIIHHSLSCTVFSESQVREIRNRFAKGESYRRLSIAFGVAPKTISNCVNGITYQHIT